MRRGAATPLRQKTSSICRTKPDPVGWLPGGSAAATSSTPRLPSRSAPWKRPPGTTSKRRRSTECDPGKRWAHDSRTSLPPTLPGRPPPVQVRMDQPTPRRSTRANRGSPRPRCRARPDRMITDRRASAHPVIARLSSSLPQQRRLRLGRTTTGRRVLVHPGIVQSLLRHQLGRLPDRLEGIGLPKGGRHRRHRRHLPHDARA